MKLKRKTHDIFNWVLVITFLLIAGRQVLGTDYQTRINEIQERRKELYQQMDEASKAGDTNAYNIALDEYNKLGDELEELSTAESDKITKAKNAYNRGNKAVKLRQFQEAIDAYNQAIELDPAMANAYYGKAIALKYLKQYDESETAYQKAIELDPTNSKAYLSLGNLYRAKEEYNQAIQVYYKALEQDSSLDKAYYEIGYTYSKQKNDAKAAEAFKKAVALNPRYNKALNALGVAYTNIGQYQSAIKVLKQAIEIKSRDGDSYYRLAEAYNNLGRYNNAITAANSALEYLKKNKQAHAHIEKGKAYEGLGNISSAIASYQEAGKDKRFANWVNWKIDALKKQSQ